MIVSKIKHYITERGEASSKDIAVHFGINPEALKDILGLLVAKGMIQQKQEAKSVCGTSCCKCAVASCETQRWETVVK